MNRRIVNGAAALALATAASAGEMKSDPANHYLDPEEIRPIVRDSIESTIVLNSRRENTTFSGVGEFDIRLIPEQIPLYTIDGHVAAYLYIAYAFPGSLPTFDDIISGALDSYEAREEYYASTNRPDWRKFFTETFPYDISCAFEIVGVNEKWPSAEGSVGIPRIIMNRKKAEDAARAYFGTKEFSFVRYIYCSKLMGYEYTNGDENIIVPFHRSGEVDSENVMRRADVDARITEYIWTREPAQVESFFGRWQKKLDRETGARFDYFPTDYEITDKGNWCYLYQTYYDNKFYVWKDDTGLWDHIKKYPKLREKGYTEPRQYSLFGKCAAIAAASSSTLELLGGGFRNPLGLLYPYP